MNSGDPINSCGLMGSRSPRTPAKPSVSATHGFRQTHGLRRLHELRRPVFGRPTVHRFRPDKLRAVSADLCPTSAKFELVLIPEARPPFPDVQRWAEVPAPPHKDQSVLPVLARLEALDNKGLIDSRALMLTKLGLELNGVRAVAAGPGHRLALGRSSGGLRV